MYGICDAYAVHVRVRTRVHVSCGSLTHTTISGRPSAAATDAADANARSRLPSPFLTLTITHLRESSCTGVGEGARGVCGAREGCQNARAGQ